MCLVPHRGLRGHLGFGLLSLTPTCSQHRAGPATLGACGMGQSPSHSYSLEPRPLAGRTQASASPFQQGGRKVGTPTRAEGSTCVYDL